MITAAEEKLALKLKLEQEAKKTQVELSKLDRLTELYPDLKKHTNRWGTVRYCSPFVNFKVDEVELRYNCGCCGDSPLEAWPYTTTKDGDRVYSDPPYFDVGEKGWGRDRASPGWDDKLRSKGIPEALISRIQLTFEDGDD